MNLRLLFLPLALSASAVSGATFDLGIQTGVIAPSTRGQSNTGFYGWEIFNDAANRTVPIDDSTPDIGTVVSGARFRTTNGEVHVLGSGNFYLFAGNPAEEVTVATGAVSASGSTSIILQGITAFDPYPGTWSFPSVGGVIPEFVQGVNANGYGQFWVKYTFTGNAGSYAIPFSAIGAHYSIDRFTVDTYWSATTAQPDHATFGAVPEPTAAGLGLLALAGLAARRRR